MVYNKKSTERITIEALKYYVPLFQEGLEAEERLKSDHDKLTSAELHQLETVMKLKELSVSSIAELSGPLITREINKLISTSHLRNRDDLFDLLYYAGLDGMRRGLRKFEVDKINSSSTNYLFQWIVTYAKKELTSLEAPFGIPPSRFQRYKKISAVRKKISDLNGEYATNDQVLEYFSSGKADLKTLNGKVADKNKPSQANQSITLELIEEQEEFEKKMLNVSLLDPLEDYSSEIKMSKVDNEPFYETIFGVFINSYNITPQAEVVIMSDLGNTQFTEKQLLTLDNLNSKVYRNLSIQWKNLIKDKKGPFYKFLLDNKSNQFDQVNVNSLINSIENYDKIINRESYMVLFTGGEVVEK